MYQTKSELLQAIQERFPQLGRGQKKIAQYVLAHMEEIAFLTAAQLGKRVGVSEATVVRFASLLGYDGFPDFQSHIQNMMRQDITTISRLEKRAERQVSQRSSSILQEILQADQTNLGLFAADTSEEDFSRAVELIVEARDVYICGLRSAYSLAFFLWFSLRFFLHKIHLVTPGIGDLPEQLLFASHKDVLIGISSKRYSKRTIETVRALKKRHVKVISISDNVLSPLTQLADVQFNVRTDVSSFIESQVVSMSLINALVTAVALKHKQETVEELSKLEEIFREFDTYVT
jgi:DNA-binding MurR/RpiR family transcriptional regulator